MFPSPKQLAEGADLAKLCSTVSALYDACANKIHVPQLDRTALEALLQYQDSVWRNHPDPPLQLILDRPTFDVVVIVSKLVEQKLRNKHCPKEKGQKLSFQ
ncbi:unnamed protein product [Gongylonema pulchrum]|uniref:SEC63 domain-containing protein n=1 Tax=Gongylonema pulchrum TaxID=637853 RepID=A0A183CZ69_9BILA|nr:unnamed protein product [Gongylonema pulchrum]